MGLNSDRDGPRNFAQGGGFRDGIEDGVDEVLDPAGIEIAGVVLLDNGAVDDANLCELGGADDGAIGDWAEPEDFDLGLHAGPETRIMSFAIIRGDIEKEMEWLIALG